MSSLLKIGRGLQLEDLVWAAGLFEGEGTVTIARRGQGVCSGFHRAPNRVETVVCLGDPGCHRVRKCHPIRMRKTGRKHGNVGP